MNKQMTVKVNGKYVIARPPVYKREYHGNGKAAWYGQTEVINGHKVDYVSYRYSYRWHKMRVYFDGCRLMTAVDYRLADALLNEKRKAGLK